jgi:hypothetical protein
MSILCARIGSRVVVRIISVPPSMEHPDVLLFKENYTRIVTHQKGIVVFFDTTNIPPSSAGMALSADIIKFFNSLKPVSESNISRVAIWVHNSYVALIINGVLQLNDGTIPVLVSTDQEACKKFLRSG